MKSNPIFFDIRFVEGQYQIIINKAHPAYLDFFNLLEKESDGKSVDDPSSDRAIKLMLAAWAYLEDESSSNNSEYSNYLQDIRLRWGQIFRDLLTTAKPN
jgi:TorA maturation chaperone TorD